MHVRAVVNQHTEIDLVLLQVIFDGNKGAKGWFQIPFVDLILSVGVLDIDPMLVGFYMLYAQVYVLATLLVFVGMCWQQAFVTTPFYPGLDDAMMKIFPHQLMTGEYAYIFTLQPIVASHMDIVTSLINLRTEIHAVL